MPKLFIIRIFGQEVSSSLVYHPLRTRQSKSRIRNSASCPVAVELSDSGAVLPAVCLKEWPAHYMCCIYRQFLSSSGSSHFERLPTWLGTTRPIRRLIIQAYNFLSEQHTLRHLGLLDFPLGIANRCSRCHKCSRTMFPFVTLLHP